MRTNDLPVQGLTREFLVRPTGAFLNPSAISRQNLDLVDSEKEPMSLLSSGEFPRQQSTGNAYSQLLDRNGQWIGVADTKVGVMLGFLLATFPVFVAPALPVVLKIMKAIPRHAPFWMHLPAAGFIALLVLLLVTALLTLVHVLMTLTPRLTCQGKPCLIFFGDIAS